MEIKLKESKLKIKMYSDENLQKIYRAKSKLNPTAATAPVLGFFDPEDYVIYLCNSTDLKTIFHELAHAILHRYYANTVYNILKSDSFFDVFDEFLADFVAHLFYIYVENETKIKKMAQKGGKNDKEKR